MRSGVLLIVLMVVVACGSGTPNQASSPTPLPVASSFDDYALAFCSAWASLFHAVGNPDTAEGSELSKALDAAVAAHDGARAAQLAAEITAELESARQVARVAGGWSPATPMMTQMDRVLVGFEVMTGAKVSKAKDDPNAVDPQAALEGSGAIDAWGAMLEAYRAIGSERPADVRPCPGVPISP